MLANVFLGSIPATLIVGPISPKDRGRDFKGLFSLLFSLKKYDLTIKNGHLEFSGARWGVGGAT